LIALFISSMAPNSGRRRRPRCSLGWDLKQADQHLNPPRPSAYRRIDEVAKKRPPARRLFDTEWGVSLTALDNPLPNSLTFREDQMLSMSDEASVWRDRAEQARETANLLTDPGAREAVLQVAETFERLARAAANPATIRRREMIRQRHNTYAN
jgi:hypothetical protein